MYPYVFMNQIWYCVSTIYAFTFYWYIGSYHYSDINDKGDYIHNLYQKSTYFIV